jgi:hypothetical protein
MKSCSACSTSRVSEPPPFERTAASLPGGGAPLKRLAVWLLETLVQVPLAMAMLAVLVLLSGEVPEFDSFGLRILLFAVMVFMVGSGYPLTTAVVGVFFRHSLGRLYPLVTTLLFLTHAHLFVAGWTLPSAEQVSLEIGGAVVVFCVTSVGNRLLRRWTRG